MDKLDQSETTTRESQVFHIAGALERPIDHIDRALASGKVNLTIDFSGCTFLTVGGLEWLEEILLRADSMKLKIEFVHLSPTIYKVLKVAHIDSVLRACGAPPRLGPTC